MLKLLIGGSAIMAVDVLKSRGVPEERILFLNLIASPQGIKNFATKFPRTRVVTAFVDQVSPHFSREIFMANTKSRASTRRSIFHSLPLIIHGSVTNLYVAILSRAWVTLAIGSTPCNVWLDSWSYIAGRFWVHKPDV